MRRISFPFGVRGSLFAPEREFICRFCFLVTATLGCFVFLVCGFSLFSESPSEGSSGRVNCATIALIAYRPLRRVRRVLLASGDGMDFHPPVGL